MRSAPAPVSRETLISWREAPTGSLAHLSNERSINQARNVVNRKGHAGLWPEIKNYAFGYTELAELLVKNLDIREGLWGIYTEFAFCAANVPIASDAKTIAPASISMIMYVASRRFHTIGVVSDWRELFTRRTAQSRLRSCRNLAQLLSAESLGFH